MALGTQPCQINPFKHKKLALNWNGCSRQYCAVGVQFNYSLWPNSSISFIDLRPLRLRPSRLCASVLAHLYHTANINALNPWYECLGAVCCHWLFSPPPSVGGIGSRQQKQRLRAPRRRSRLVFWSETHPNGPNMRCVHVNPSLFKAAIGPTLACMVLKKGLKRLSS